MSSVWNTAPSHSGTVTLDTHTAYLSVSGPPRTSSSQPVIIVEAGHGDCSNTYPALVRAISPFARIYTYDRAGYNFSSPSASPRTASNLALELSSLLDSASVAGPYVLVAHSYGGILAREFLALRPKDVMGMVLIDTVQEADTSDPDNQWPLTELHALGEGLDIHEVMGLNATHKLTPSEWEFALLAEKNPSFSETADREEVEFVASNRELGLKKQFQTAPLGEGRVSVVKGDAPGDIEKLLAAGVERGNGTEEQRRVLKEWVGRKVGISEVNQREQLKLSKEGRGRMVVAERSGHSVQFQQPELVAEEVKWVLGL